MLTQCPVCLSSNLGTIVNYPRLIDNNFYSQIINCSNCNSATALPFKDQNELNQFYNSGAYWDNASSGNLNMHTLTQAEVRVKYVLSRISLKNSSPLIMDVGAGHGNIATALKKNGIACSKNFSFIEPDNKLSNLILTHFPDAQKRSFNDSSCTYDLIFLNHILEHTASPADIIKSYGQFLNEDGKIYIEVPHRDDKFKNNVFPHSIFFSKKGLKTMIEQSGLKCLEINCFGSLEGINPPITLTRKIRFKIINRLLLYTMRLNLTKIAKMLDRAIFDYKTERHDGIWIRALCAK